MAKIIRKKRTLRIERVAIVLFVLACGLSLVSSLFLRSYNNSLSMQVQKMETEIAKLETANEAAQVAIQNLSTKDRVLTVATEEGLTMNSVNVVTIAGGE